MSDSTKRYKGADPELYRDSAKADQVSDSNTQCSKCGAWRAAIEAPLRAEIERITNEREHHREKRKEYAKRVIDLQDDNDALRALVSDAYAFIVNLPERIEHGDGTVPMLFPYNLATKLKAALKGQP